MANFSKSPDPRFTGRRPDFARQVDYYSDKLHSLRVVTTALLEGEQAKKELARMGDRVTIKGLAESVAAAKKSISDARAAPAALQEAVKALKLTCDDLTKQVAELHDDIKFEATELGNGGEASETKSDAADKVAS